MPDLFIVKYFINGSDERRKESLEILFYSDVLGFSLISCRTVKFWDLETFQLVSSTDGDSSPVRLDY